jgi:hypothetical protein
VVNLRERMRGHVEEEAALLGAEVVIAPPGTAGHAETRASAFALVSARIIVPPIRSRVTYYIALHELGHVEAARGNALNPKGELGREAQAWDWALYQAIVPPSERTWRMIRRSWLSYVAAVADTRAKSAGAWIAELKDGAAEQVPEWERAWYRQVWHNVQAGRAPTHLAA